MPALKFLPANRHRTRSLKSGDARAVSIGKQRCMFAAFGGGCQRDGGPETDGCDKGGNTRAGFSSLLPRSFSDPSDITLDDFDNLTQRGYFEWVGSLSATASIFFGEAHSGLFTASLVGSRGDS